MGGLPQSMRQEVEGGPESTAPSRRHRGDRLKQLRAFCHAAALESITRAAERILSSQPIVSRQVRALERQLAVTLFERRGPRIVLTPAGRCLYRLAKPLVEGLDRLSDSFVERYHHVPSGDLALATGQTAATCVLPAYLGRFRDRHPGTRVNVRVAGGWQRLRWLRAYEVDIVFAAVDVPPADIEFRPIFSSEIVFITPEDHPLAGRESVDLAEVARYPAVTFLPESHVGQAGETIMRQHGQSPDCAVEVDEWSLVKRCVEAGVGVSAVPEVCLTERDRVWRIPAAGWFPPRTYGTLTRRDDSLPLAARWFMRTMGPSVSDEP